MICSVSSLCFIGLLILLLTFETMCKKSKQWTEMSKYYFIDLYSGQLVLVIACCRGQFRISDSS